MLTLDQLDEFDRNGFIVVRNAASDEDLCAVERDLLTRLDELALFLEVDLGTESFSLNDRMLELERSSPGAALTFIHSRIVDPALFEFWSSSKMLDIAQSILGEDIDGHPVFNIRPKPPESGLFVVPWHQDSAYLADGAQESPQLTFWVPLMDATIENGCMELAVGEHRAGEMRHVASRDYEEYGNSSWYLDLEDSLTSRFKTEVCEMKRGDVLVFTHLTPHCSLPNLSQYCRWSIDMRYVRSDCFLGTSQAPIPFRRGDVELKNMVESAKNEFAELQRKMDRARWRHRVDQAVWRDRWA